MDSVGQKPCLRRVIPLGEGHLRKVVHEYLEHYLVERNHQGLDNRLLATAGTCAKGRVRSRERLGGTLNFYYRDA